MPVLSTMKEVETGGLQSSGLAWATSEIPSHKTKTNNKMIHLDSFESWIDLKVSVQKKR